MVSVCVVKCEQIGICSESHDGKARRFDLPGSYNSRSSFVARHPKSTMNWTPQDDPLILKHAMSKRQKVWYTQPTLTYGTKGGWWFFHTGSQLNST